VNLHEPTFSWPYSIHVRYVSVDPLDPVALFAGCLRNFIDEFVHLPRPANDLPESLLKIMTTSIRLFENLIEIYAIIVIIRLLILTKQIARWS